MRRKQLFPPPADPATHRRKHNKGRQDYTILTVNGRILETFPVRAGERLRLRLINAANARIFALEFQGHDPMVVALDGWIDAGMGAANAMTVLQSVTAAETVAEFDTDRLLDHRARRPVVQLVNGLITDLTWPAIELQAGVDSSSNDVLLLVGAEPDFEWRAFTDTVIELAHSFDCRMLVHTSARGFREIWHAVLESFSASNAVGALRFVISDMGATPAVVTLRLSQALAAYTDGR